MSGTYFQAKLKASTHPEIIIEASQKYQCRKKKKKTHLEFVILSVWH